MSQRRAFVRRAILWAAAFMITLWAPATAAALPEGSPSDQGSVLLVDGSGQSLNGAGSATVFSLRLPDGAACPGDSMHDQWRVQSFLVPSTIDVGNLQYNVIGPQGDDQFALYTTADRPFTDQNLLPNSVAGAPGIIGALPAFHFTRFPVGILPAGTYRVGIACTLFRETATYWDTELVITASADDEPAQFVWSLVDTPPDLSSESAGDSSGSAALLIVVVVGLVVALGGFVWWTRGRAAHTPSSQRTSS